MLPSAMMYSILGSKVSILTPTAMANFLLIMTQTAPVSMMTSRGMHRSMSKTHVLLSRYTAVVVVAATLMADDAGTAGVAGLAGAAGLAGEAGTVGASSASLVG